jgi:hypothetical protein
MSAIDMHCRVVIHQFAVAESEYLVYCRRLIMKASKADVKIDKIKLNGISAIFGSLITSIPLKEMALWLATRGGGCLFLLNATYLHAFGEQLGVGFKIGGTISFVQYGQNNQVISTNEKYFEGRFLNEQWHISTKDTGKSFTSAPMLEMLQSARKKQGSNNVPNLTTNLSWVGGTDGRDNYLLGVLGNYEGSVDCRARSGIIPYNEVGSMITPIWLAFGSASYLATNSLKSIPPMWPYRDPKIFLSGYKLMASWITSDQPPFLPNSILFTNCGIEFLTEAGPEGVTTKSNKLAFPYDKGFLEAEYITSGRTNLADMSFPVEFNFIVYRLQKKSSNTIASAMERRLSYHGNLTSVELFRNDGQSFSPVINNLRPLVIDERFKDIEPNLSVSYVLTNNVWPTKDNPTLNDIFNKSRTDSVNRPKAVSRQAQGSFFVRFTVAATFFVSLVVVLFAFRAANKTRTSV